MVHNLTTITSSIVLSIRSPVKVHTGPSELGTFLNDIEYPQSMLFRTINGVKLTGEERDGADGHCWSKASGLKVLLRAKVLADEAW